MNLIKRHWKYFLISAGVIASAVFYAFTPEGRELLSESPVTRNLPAAEEDPLFSEDLFLFPETGTEEPPAKTQDSKPAAPEAGTPVPGNTAAAFSEEELREIVREAVSEAVRDTVKQEFDSLLESGRFTEAAAAYAETQSGLVNLNTADAGKLKTLSGIGDAKAAAILRYREEHGRFQSIEELLQVDGISENLFSKIRDSLTV